MEEKEITYAQKVIKERIVHTKASQLKKEENMKISSRFCQSLLEKIVKKKKNNEMSQQFQDLHWDDVYNVYYDTSIG